MMEYFFLNDNAPKIVEIRLANELKAALCEISTVGSNAQAGYQGGHKYIVLGVVSYLKEPGMDNAKYITTVTATALNCRRKSVKAVKTKGMWEFPLELNEKLLKNKRY